MFKRGDDIAIITVINRGEQVVGFEKVDTVEDDYVFLEDGRRYNRNGMFSGDDMCRNYYQKIVKRTETHDIHYACGDTYSKLTAKSLQIQNNLRMLALQERSAPLAEKFSKIGGEMDKLIELMES